MNLININIVHLMGYIDLGFSIFLILSIFVYRYVFPQKKINPLIVVILFSILPIFNIFRPGDYESGELWVHIIRLINFNQSLSDGNIIPVWAKDSNMTYGYPMLMFDAPLEYYVSSFFHFLGFSFVTSIKLFLASSFIAAGIAMYFWAKQELGKISAYVSAIFYTFSPFHLTETHFRVSVGEVSLFTFIPLILLSSSKIIYTGNLSWFILNSFFIALMIISSPTSLIVFIFILIYDFFIILINKKTKFIINLILSHLSGLLLSSFYCVPVLLEAKYTLAYYGKNILFIPIKDFILGAYNYGLLFQGHNGEASYFLGIIQWIIIFLSILYLLKNKFIKSDKKMLIFFLITFFIILFLMTPQSLFLWNFFPILKNLQFSFRLLLLISFIIAAIAGIFVKIIKKQWIIILICFIAIFSTILNWHNRRNIPNHDDNFFIANIPTSTRLGEGSEVALPIWTGTTAKQGFAKQIPKTHLEIIDGNASYKEILRTSTKHEYVLDAYTNVSIKENTLYFPGWSILANGNIQNINYTNPSYPGVMSLHLKKGLYKIDVVFSDTSTRLISKIISLLTFIFLMTLPVYYWFNKKLYKR